MYFSKILMITSAAQVLGQRAPSAMVSVQKGSEGGGAAGIAGGSKGLRLGPAPPPERCAAVEAEAAVCAAAYPRTYALTALNADSCPAEMASITTVEECQLATSFIGYSWREDGEAVWADCPAGCFCVGNNPDWEKCYWNTNPTGPGRADVRPLCARAPADDNKDRSTKVDSKVLALPAAKHLRERGDVLALAGVSDANTMVGSKALEAEVAALTAENAVLKNENAVLKAAAAATE